MVIKIYSSKKLIFFALFLYLGAGSALVNNAMPLVCKLLGGLLLAINAKKYFQRYIFLSDARSIVSLLKTNSAFWSLQMSNGEEINGELKNNSLISHFLLALNFNCERGFKCTVLLTPESIGLDEYRRLLVHLYHTSPVGPVQGVRPDISA